MTTTAEHANNLLTYGLAVEYLPMGDWSTKAVRDARGRLYRAGKKAGVRVIVSSTGEGVCVITAVIAKAGPAR